MSNQVEAVFAILAISGFSRFVDRLGGTYAKKNQETFGGFCRITKRDLIDVKHQPEFPLLLSLYFGIVVTIALLMIAK